MISPLRQQELRQFAAHLQLPSPTDLDWELFDRALIHPSAALEKDNDRLEFLGDAILRLVITDFLYSTFPAATPGELTALRSQLTSDHFLAELATLYGLERYLVLGDSARLDHHGRPRRLADAWEALLGALFLSWHQQTLPYLRQWLDPHLQRQSLMIQRDPTRLNPKAALQEYTQRVWNELPHYELIGSDGPANAPKFTMRVSIQGQCWGEGIGSSKKAAEAAAAQIALTALGQVAVES